MGTDIHGVFQRHDKVTGKWHDVPSEFQQNRHYQLFAVLAGVRNGYGFAGIVTGDAVTPIDEPRGLPDDFNMDDDSHPIASVEIMYKDKREHHQAGDKLEIWMGDHSYSWISGEEMLAWAKNAPVVSKVGILDRATYDAWSMVSSPDRYCGDVYGSNVVLVNDSDDEKEKAPNWTHIRCTWKSDLRDELAYFFDEVSRLATEHGEVRFVFGFDS